jgi:hypothetical protein
LYVSPIIIRVIKSRITRWIVPVASKGEMRNAYRILTGIPEGKRPLERSRRGWEDNIRTDPREMGWEGVEWIHLAQDRDQWWALVNT